MIDTIVSNFAFTNQNR